MAASSTPQGWAGANSVLSQLPWEKDKTRERPKPHLCLTHLLFPCHPVKPARDFLRQPALQVLERGTALHPALMDFGLSRQVHRIRNYTA